VGCGCCVVSFLLLNIMIHSSHTCSRKKNILLDYPDQITRHQGGGSRALHDKPEVTEQISDDWQSSIINKIRS
jgi:hypothetical protein